MLLGPIDESLKFLGQLLFTSAGCMSRNLHGNGQKTIIVAFRIASH